MKEKITITIIHEKIRTGHRISMLALYDYPLAVLAEQAGVDAIIVGDSVAMNVYGYPDTLQADMEMMIRHTQAVRRGAPDVFLIGDMPYMSYQNVETAIHNAGRFIREGNADAVKLEGGRSVLETVQALVSASIPVVGHLGLLPQSAALAGGFKAQGREAESAMDIVDQAKILEQAGICMLILECVPPNVSETIAKRTSVPVIGIGSGPACHGQVQIIYDILGLYPRPTAKFVHKYAELAPPIIDAIKTYISDLDTGKYPTPEHCYRMKPGEEEEFQRRLA
ncbi:MAG: 3-methyl-2-oxobutanoate hydroxymethyltransferase [Phycisphaerae bacterium]